MILPEKVVMPKGRGGLDSVRKAGKKRMVALSEKLDEKLHRRRYEKRLSFHEEFFRIGRQRERQIAGGTVDDRF